ncbi:MAG: SDR family NAD(P)-dependent oxidoreductase [Mycobacteriaceae bacterium]|nr:SDR family NAD(P)-dependent oxidoreductase [Mycobacteriaceae bacterium]
MKSLAGKVAVVTGAGSGIGREVALELARGGARLALSDVNSESVAAVADQCRTLGAQVHEQRLDVADAAAVFEYADAVAGHFGAVNLVVNNAGVMHFGSVEETSLEQIRRVVDIDLWGVIHGTKAFLPHLIKSGDGHVVNISSVFGLFGIPTQSAYNAAKFAVRGFTETLRQEMLVAGHPVAVTCVHPGAIKTELAYRASIADGDRDAINDGFDRMARTTPQQAARTIVAGIRAGKPRILVGADARVLDKLVRLLGPHYQRPLAAMVKRLSAA